MEGSWKGDAGRGERGGERRGDARGRWKWECDPRGGDFEAQRCRVRCGPFKGYVAGPLQPLYAAQCVGRRFIRVVTVVGFAIGLMVISLPRLPSSFWHRPLVVTFLSAHFLIKAKIGVVKRAVLRLLSASWDNQSIFSLFHRRDRLLQRRNRFVPKKAGRRLLSPICASAGLGSMVRSMGTG